MTIGSETLHTDDINQDLFVAKLDPQGELLWRMASEIAKRIGAGASTWAKTARPTSRGVSAAP